MADKPPLDYESLKAPHPARRRGATGSRFVGYSLLFVGGSILTGTGTIAYCISDHGPGGLVALGGGVFMAYILFAMFFGGEESR